MSKEIEDFLAEINGGSVRGAKAKMATDLGLSQATISKYCSGEAIPSEQSIKDMAKKYKKSEDEIKNIFGIPAKEKLIQHNVKNKDCQIQQIIGTFEAELIKEKLKTLEAKIDLVLQILRGVK